MNRPSAGSGSVRPADRASASAALPLSSSADQTGSELAREMRRRWTSGERPPAEAFLTREPATADHAESAVELIYEEFCLRDALGEREAEQDILRRFPQWADPLRVMLDCHRRVIQSQRERPRYPVAGERLGEFLLTAEISRGARGRVFLATQSALADRPVVLKVTPLDGGEHLSLARLQHTNIVPLYSVLDDAARNVRVLCMPFFGRATLASLLESLKEMPPVARTGADVVRAIDREQDPAPSLQATASAARQMLGCASYAQAMCWIAAAVADALQFAHERGVLHLDLKPSNILLATDGQPMLLDFHLARGPICAGCATVENVGGTPPYMPPEQHAAMSAMQNGEPVERAVDGCADVFALGAILYESLGGQLPLGPDVLALSGVNPQVTPGLSDIVAKCIAPCPADRYIDARSLAEDLRRHLTNQPLIGITNRSTRERWTKWRRRRPHALRVAAMLAVIAMALLLLLVGALFYASDRTAQATRALAEGQAQLRDPRAISDAVQSFRGGLQLLDGLPFHAELRTRLSEQLATASRLELAHELHDLANEVRVLYGIRALPPARKQTLAANAIALWDRRDAIRATLGNSPPASLSADLQEMAIFAARASGPDVAERLLGEAESEFGPSELLHLERRLHGLSDNRATNSAVTSQPVDPAWSHYALGRALLEVGDLARAREDFAAAVAIEPADAWANFYSGLCAYRMGHPAEAVAAFSVCIGASPDVASCYYNRALAYAALERTDQALADYDRTLKLDPVHADALLNRGMIRYGQGRSNDAIADLRAALANGADGATVHYDLALVHAAAGDRSTALAEARAAVQGNPANEQAARLRDTLQQSADDHDR